VHEVGPFIHDSNVREYSILDVATSSSPTIQDLSEVATLVVDGGREAGSFCGADCEGGFESLEVLSADSVEWLSSWGGRSGPCSNRISGT